MNDLDIGFSIIPRMIELNTKMLLGQEDIGGTAAAELAVYNSTLSDRMVDLKIVDRDHSAICFDFGESDVTTLNPLVYAESIRDTINILNHNGVVKNTSSPLRNSIRLLENLAEKEDGLVKLSFILSLIINRYANSCLCLFPYIGLKSCYLSLRSPTPNILSSREGKVNVWLADIIDKIMTLETIGDIVDAIKNALKEESINKIFSDPTLPHRQLIEASLNDKYSSTRKLIESDEHEHANLRLFFILYVISDVLGELE